VELLKKCQGLYDELKTIGKDLDYLDEKLSRHDTDADEYQDLYENEFRLSMSMMGCYQDLCHYLDLLKEDENMIFLATRIKTNAEAIVTSGGLDINMEDIWKN